MKVCLSCQLGFHYECRFSKKCCCPPEVEPVAAVHITNRLKTDQNILDIKSTGRKRAALAYPIEKGMKCEWQGLKFAGGGKYPIVGCIDKDAKDRHHGPDKSTLNNSEGNVHRICGFCHNRWHTKNDPVYDALFGTEDWQGHDSETRASSKEFALNEAYWVSHPTLRYRDKEDEQVGTTEGEEV